MTIEEGRQGKAYLAVVEFKLSHTLDGYLLVAAAVDCLVDV